MKKLLFIMMSILVILSLATVSYASSKQVTGSITSINKEKNTFTVKGKNGDVTLAVNDKTKIMSEELKTIGDLKTGDKVIVEYSATGDATSAKKVTIKPLQEKDKK